MIQLIALHGFLNRGDLFDQTLGHWAADHPELEFSAWAPDLFSPDSPLSADLTMSEWAERFCELVEVHTHPEEPRVIMGYSMGGRLAMQVLLAYPQLWSAGVLISAHPGEEDNAQRQEWRESWMDRFSSEENFSQVVNEWQSQELLASSPGKKYKVREEDFDREALALALARWDRTQHLFSLEEVEDIGRPLLWCWGQQDGVYSQLYRQLKEQGIPGQWTEVPGAGHRVPVDAPRELASAMVKFLQSIGLGGQK